MLKCFDCGKLLSTPVNECKEDHLACSSCCKGPGKTCPFSSCDLGYSRCWVVEQVLSSLTLRLRNADDDCKEVEAYDSRDKLSSHEEECAFGPFPCPFPGCNQLCFSTKLSPHFRAAHFHYGKTFQLDEAMQIYLGSNSEAYILEKSKRKAASSS